MLGLQTIQAAAERVAAAASEPCRVILFGSYARETADEDSDLDLMVIEQEVVDKTEYLRLRKAIGRVGTVVDMLIYAKDEAMRRSQVPGTLLYWAFKEGKVLHDGLAIEGWGAEGAELERQTRPDRSAALKEAHQTAYNAWLAKKVADSQQGLANGSNARIDPEEWEKLRAGKRAVYAR